MNAVMFHFGEDSINSLHIEVNSRPSSLFRSLLRRRERFSSSKESQPITTINADIANSGKSKIANTKVETYSLENIDNEDRFKEFSSKILDNTIKEYEIFIK